MSPRPRSLSGSEVNLLPSATAITSNGSNQSHPPTPTPMNGKGKEEGEKLEEYRKFLRMENMFGLEQYQFNILYVGSAHLMAVYFTYLQVVGLAPLKPFLFETVYGYIGGLGITVGCHRYWTHKTFKANRPLQYMLMIFQTIANQYSIYKWSLDHRVHHKYTDTDADPHNSLRGFWYSHMGWLYLPKTPEHKEKLKTFDMPDLERDPVVRFQAKWYWTLTFIFHLALPISVLYFGFGMPLFHCVACNFRRYVMSLHITWTVNSVAHMWGEKPYDKSITPVENPWVALFAVGEGWHNYHHTFPWDYKASEFGWKFNMSTIFIDFFAWLGWAHDLKTVSQKMLKERLRRTGDGSHNQAGIGIGEGADGEENENDFDYRLSADVTELMKSSMDQPIWGWDDEIPDEFRRFTKVLRPEGDKHK